MAAVAAMMEMAHEALILKINIFHRGAKLGIRKRS
jgi:hypothetical protein